MPAMDKIPVPVDLLRRLAAYIESCPSGPHAAGVPMSLLTELEFVCKQSTGTGNPVTAKAAAEAAVEADSALQAARDKAARQRAKEAKAAKKRAKKKGRRK